MVQPLYTCFGDVYSSKLIWDEYKAYGLFFFWLLKTSGHLMQFHSHLLNDERRSIT